MEPVVNPNLPRPIPLRQDQAILAGAALADTWDILVNAIKRTYIFPSRSCSGTSCAPLGPMGTAELGGSGDFSSDESWLCWIVMENDSDPFFPSCKYVFPFGLLSFLKESLHRCTPLGR